MAQENLPVHAEEVIKVIGVSQFYHLRRWWLDGKKGAQVTQLWIYIPAELTPSHPLVTAIGVEDAQKLVRAFGGENMYFPKCANCYRSYRDLNIRRLYRDGLPTAELAEWFEMSARQIRNVVAEIRLEATTSTLVQYRRRTQRSGVKMQTNLPATGYLRAEQIISTFLPIARSTLWAWVKSGKFPQPVKLGERVTAWKCEDVRDWMEKRDAASTKVAH